ncbi:hypothetical protein CEXT_516981 [Caerostris extrusa]|uniref:DUF4817 domain-containing protein n=1 Tax=Caerostris extrusa TaxID=172846 RepID=A0AAV4XZY0_CAEEX|nr:hypothetical protein CEXT_516981 [Caerostris extrusa]
MKGMRDSKGPITSSALKKMMKKFEATGSLASRQRSGRPSTTSCCCHDSGQTVQSMSVVAAHGGVQCSRGRQGVAQQCLESIANNSEAVSLQVAT